MKHLIKAIGVALLLAMLLPTATYVSAFAAETENEEYIIQSALSAEAGDELADSNELLEGYLQQQIYEMYGIAPFGLPAFDGLTKYEQEIFTKLKNQIQNILTSSPETGSTSTQFTFTFDQALSVTKQEIGVDSFGETVMTEDGAQFVLNDETDAAIEEKFDLSRLYMALLSDMPYELFWHDKTTNSSLSWKISYTSTTLSVSNVYLTLPVSQDYAVTSGNSYYPTLIDNAKIHSIDTAIENAQQIVTNNASKSDYEKLLAYKEAICDLVEYHDDAAENANYPYGNPWQLIWVFDNNTSTNVVCEGYAKAFKYLCDMSTFDDEGLYCYLVSGYLGSESDSNGHMWNVVEANGKYYIVDVTNCDEGTIGSGSLKLFMNGTSAINERTYTFNISGRALTFIYKTSQKDLYCEGYPTLSKQSYLADLAGMKTLTVTGGTGGGTYTPGDSVTIKANTPGTNQKFDKWVIKSGSLSLTTEQQTSSTLKITMPNNDVTIEATYHTHDFTNGEYDSDATYHRKLCADCGDPSTSKTRHSFVQKTNDTHHWQECTVCSYEKSGSKTEHSYSEWESNTTQHRKECSCGKQDGTTIADHDFATRQYNDTNHYDACACGAVDNSTPHSLKLNKNDDEHWEECENCDYASTKQNHSYTSEVTKPATTESNGEKTFTCSACSHSYTEPIEKLTATTPDNPNNGNTGNSTDGEGNNTDNQAPSIGSNEKDTTPYTPPVPGSAASEITPSKKSSSCGAATSATAVLMLTVSIFGCALIKKKED